LFETGRTHFNDAKARLDSRDPPAAAYWDFLVAYQIVVIAIPAHREYYDRIAQSRSGLYRDYNHLLKARAH
jgi:ubiquitin carboxyl-terminal hydrolase 8